MNGVSMKGDWGIGRLLTKGLLVLVVLVFGFGSWAVFAQISGAVIVPAHVDVGANRHTLQHPRGGKVVAVHVKNGERVVAGQELLQLDAGQMQTEHAILQGQRAALLARHTRLLAEQSNSDLIFPAEFITLTAALPDVTTILENERSLFDAQNDLQTQALAQLDQQRRQLTIQRDGILAERRAVQSRFVLVAATLEDQQALLRKGLTQAERVSNLAQQSAMLEGDLARLETAFADVGARESQVSLDALRLKSDRYQKVVAELSDTDIRLVGLEEQLRALSTGIAAQKITAPIDGVIHGMGFTVRGAIIRPGEPILEVLPINEQPRAVASLKPAHIDQVHLGQSVSLRLPDLGNRNAPELQGTVTHISADAFVDQGSGQRFYRVNIDIPKDSMVELGDANLLLPGMSVEAFLHTGAKRPIAYLTDPFLDYFRKAFRER
ncbi:MAG: HlyD family type I secretion periplasmic adaptor subunit [Planktomarina sp.]